MTRRTYTKGQTVFHAAYMTLLTVGGLMAAYSTFYILHNASCTEDRIAAGFAGFFSLLLLSVDFFECRAMGARLYMDGDGLGFRRFGRTRVFIKWSEIRQIGTGSIPTPFGSRKRIYFCDRALDEGEAADLITLKYHTVHFTYIPKAWYREMQARLPVPIPKEIEEKYVK